MQLLVKFNAKRVKNICFFQRSIVSRSDDYSVVGGLTCDVEVKPSGGRALVRWGRSRESELLEGGRAPTVQSLPTGVMSTGQRTAGVVL